MKKKKPFAFLNSFLFIEWTSYIKCCVEIRYIEKQDNPNRVDIYLLANWS